MIMMDLKSGSWVGGIYQKFEAMCADVEEVMYEDTLKYVENKVRTVGETVKKFYSDVMQDLNPPSSLDSVKAEDLILTVVHQGDVKICRNQKVDDKNDSVDAASEQLVKDFDGAAAFDDSIHYGSFCPGICSEITPCKPKSKNSAGEKSTEVVSKSHETESALTIQSSSVEKDLDYKRDSQNKCLSDLVSIEATLTNDSDELVTSIAPHGEGDEPPSVLRDIFLKEASEVSNNEDDVGISWEVTEGYGRSGAVKEKKTIFLSDGLLSADIDNPSIPSIACEFKRCDFDKHEVLVGEQRNEVRLEESCVLVEKYEHSSKSALEHAQKSYKKKIHDVFSPRRWSKSKRDQEQVAAWYHQQSEKNLLSTSSTLTKIQKPQVSESFESDWELL